MDWPIIHHDTDSMNALDMTWSLLGDPAVQTAVIAVIAGLLGHFTLRGNPRQHLLGAVAFFVILTALLVYRGITPYDASPPQSSSFRTMFIGIAKVAWWASAALALVGITRVFLIFERRPREGRLIQDLLVGLIYLGAILAVISNVFSFPVGTLIATSGVVAIILGLALQSTLSDVFSGIALNISRPYKIGDWITLGNTMEGKVLETNWRATYLMNASNDLIILPNSILARSALTNASSADLRHGVKLSVRFTPMMPPLAIARVMQDVLLSCNFILPKPAPAVHVKALDAHALELELSFHVADLAASGVAKDEVYDRIYRHTKAAGLTLSPPVGAPAEAAEDTAGRIPKAVRPTPLRLLEALPLFSSLTSDEKEVLASTMARKTYRKGDVVVEEGAELTSLMILRQGVLAVTRHRDSGDMDVSRLAPGDFFGEEGLLLGERQRETLRALTFVVLYEISKESLAPLMQDRPSLAEELSDVLAQRAAKGFQLGSGEDAKSDGGHAFKLAERIRGYFSRHRIRH